MPAPAIIQSTGLHAQAAPYAAVGLLIVAGAAAHAAATGTEATASWAMTVGALAFTLAVLVGIRRGRRIRCPKGRRRLRVLLVGAATWLTTVTIVGINHDMITVIAILMWTTSLQWWRAKRLPDAGMVTAAASGYTALWREGPARSGKPLAGSHLGNEEKIKQGTRFTLRLVPGEQTRKMVEEERAKIRGLFGLMPANDLILEQHPTLPEPHLLMTIVTRQPPRGSILWPGPSALGADGLIALGPFADGEGIAHWKAFTENRVWGGFLQGGTGSGKSRMIESIVMALVASELFPSVAWWADGQGGASSKLLKKKCDKIALTLEQCRAMLEGVISIMDHRQEENDVEDLDGFTPTAERPAIFVVLDECHVFFADERILEMCARITREGGKVGIALICATQQAQLAAAFGGHPKYSDAIRANLLVGNGVMLRGKSKSAQQIFRVEADPTTFPPRPGYAFLADPAEGARSAPLLGYFVSDDLQAYWSQRITWRELDRGSATVYGPSYARRKEIADADREAKRLRVEARKAGRPLPVDVTVTRTISASSSSVRASTSSPFGPVTALPVWKNPGTTLVGTPQPSSAVPRVAGIHRRVAAAIAQGDVVRSGHTMPHLVAERLGVSTKWASGALKDLVELGVVHRPAGTPEGKYIPTGKLLPAERAA